MNIIKPKSLPKGGTIAIIAPSGNIDINNIDNARKYFEQKGYRVKYGSHLECKNNYLAGYDDERLEDLHWAFADNEVDMILCARGGYGALRLINKIDYDLIRNNPKIFCGYSDITIFNAMFLKKTGLVTFSGPMAMSDFSNPEKINKFTEDEFLKKITSNSVIIHSAELKFYSDKTYAEGILWGGNLSTITSLCGIDFIPDDRFIFFVEDLNEDSYRIDRYFTQLLNINKFKNNLAAVVLGDFLYLDNNKYLEDLLYQLGKNLNIPIIGRFPISHSNVKTTIPYGIPAKLQENIIITEDYLVLQ